MIKTVYIESNRIRKWWYYYLVPSGAGIDAIHHTTGKKFKRRIGVVNGEFVGGKRIACHVKPSGNLTYWKDFGELTDYWRHQKTWTVNTYKEYKSYPTGLMTVLLLLKVNGG